MEVVREVLDKKLKGNDINLVDKILSYIDPDEDYLDVCGVCGRVDTYYDDGRCKICCYKDYVMGELDNALYNYRNIYSNKAKALPQKLHKYFLKLYHFDH